MSKTTAPHSPESEAALLGSIMLGNGQPLVEVLQIIQSPADFYVSANAKVYAAMLHVHGNGTPAEIVAVKNRLNDEGELDRVGGVEYLVSLSESVPSTESTEYYAKQVRGYARHRDAIRVVSETLHSLTHDGDQLDDVLTTCERNVFALTEFDDGRKPRYIRDILAAELEVWASGGKKTRAVATGFFELDAMLGGGIHSQELLILAARPSVGKSALMMDFAEHVSRVSGPVAVFSAEMSGSMIAQRIVAKHCDIPASNLRASKLHKDDIAILTGVVARVSESELIIDDTPSPTVDEICGKARRLASSDKIVAVFVDYLQLVRNRVAGRSREQEVAEISRSLKAMARDLSLPVVCLAQLNRGPEARDDGRPKVSDLRDSGQIEQDADAVLLLYREDQHNRGNPNWDDNNIAEVIVGKQRNGATGVVKLLFDGPRTTFKNMEARHYD